MNLLIYKNHDKHPFGKYLQLRWKEPLGLLESPYLYRWTLIIAGYTIRIHHWIRSDDNRFFHDHSCNLISIILKGYYYNVIPKDNNNPDTKDSIKILCRAWRPWFANATKKHYLLIPSEGAWTLLITGRAYHKWGFYVNNHKWRPLRYFSKFGIIQDKNYTGF